MYVDGARDVILQYNEITGSQFGIEVGSEDRNDDSPVTNITVRYNIVKDNLIVGLRIGGYDKGNKTGYVKNTRIYQNVLQNNVSAGTDSAEIVIAKCDGVTFENNKINAIGGLPVSTDFSETVTKNVTFTGNVFTKKGKTRQTVEFYVFNRTVVGIAAFNEIFGENVFEITDI